MAKMNKDTEIRVVALRMAIDSHQSHAAAETDEKLIARAEKIEKFLRGKPKRGS